MADKAELFENQAEETVGSSRNAKTELGKAVAKVFDKFPAFESGESIGISDSLYLIGKQKFYMGIDYISPVMLAGALYVFDKGLNGKYSNLDDIKLLKQIKEASETTSLYDNIIENEVIEKLSGKSPDKLDEYVVVKYKVEIITYLLMINKILGVNS